MKSLLVTLAAAIFLLSCNDAGKHADTHEHETEATTTEKHAEPTALALNNGARWKADASTNTHVDNMRGFVQQYHKRSKTMEDYHTIGEELQGSLNTLVQQCTMKGADHDALHAWLEPFMTTVKDLKSAPDEQAAKAKFTSLHDQLEEYPKFFE